jgi:acyl carrier protein
MTVEEIRAAVLQALAAVAPEANPAVIDPQADLREELDLDSMDTLNLAVAIHEATGVDIPEIDYPKLATLDGAVAYLTAKLGTAPR